MFDKLDQKEKRFEELSGQLADPQVLVNAPLYKKVAKEHANLKEVVEAYRKYKRIHSEIHSHQEFLRTETDLELKELAKQELREFETSFRETEEALKLLLLPKDPDDDKNVLLEIRAGTGGDEAALFVADLFRMYSKYIEGRGWQTEHLSSNETGLRGMKEIILAVRGKSVFRDLKYESGVHRVQRVPKTEQQGRIHTSAVTVAILPEPDEVDVHVDEKELKIDTYSAGGPGGQHVNKTQSAVRITHVPTGLVVTCQDERSQHKNKARAMKILRARLYEKRRQEQADKMAEVRKGMVGTGDRSEKIRTYNFPQNRLTDHRMALTLYRLDYILDGHLEEVLPALRNHFQIAALQGD